MKAKEYYEKYKGIVASSTEEEIKEVTYQLFCEISKETVKVFDARGGKTNAALIAVLKEQNQKWNAVCNLFLKEPFGLSPFRPDGFIIFWANEFPQYQIRIHQGRGSGRTLAGAIIKEVNKND